MQILLNQNNDIIAYAVSGGIEREGYKTLTIEDNQVPDSFRELFKPSFYIFENGEIKLNPIYHEETEKVDPPQVPQVDFPTSDEALRRMFSSMQVQIVQGNKMVTQLTQQNAQLSQELVKLNQAIDDIKEVGKDENVISEV
ncbi:DUF2977 domain-containing protein [Staphylococcus arlettae]|uniref:DUF2977 domain-containing protein n=1 Tax=Staphylococcus arlettae TaxID=29378 RepID=UPI0028A503BA|nr:DUF2977 domain-containing protein [Staphylococcus arlettae]MDT4051300.1 DUF2977 domain-containing protein [Staphylococcus arlettae]